jgi:hypothetical protein
MTLLMAKSGVAGILAHRSLRRPFSFLFHSYSLLGGDGAGVPLPRSEIGLFTIGSVPHSRHRH